MKIYRYIEISKIVEASSGYTFWIDASGNLKTEDDFKGDTDISKDLFHLNTAMQQLRVCFTNDDNFVSNLSDLADPSIWNEWKQYKVKAIYSNLINDPNISSEDKDQLTQEYHSTDIDTFIGNHLDQITMNNVAGFTIEDWNSANDINFDPAEQIMSKFGWKRVSNFNVTTYDFTSSSLKAIVTGLVSGYKGFISKAYDSLAFTIEVTSTNSVYHDVPFSEMVNAVRNGTPQLLNKYRYRTDMGGHGHAFSPAMGLEDRL